MNSNIHPIAGAAQNRLYGIYVLDHLHLDDHPERTRQALYVRFRQCGSGGDWDFGDDAVLITEDSLIRGHYGAWRYVRVTPADAP